MICERCNNFDHAILNIKTNMFWCPDRKKNISSLSNSCELFIPCVELLKARLKAMYEVVKNIEWAGRPEEGFGFEELCVECDESKRHGHASDCSLAAELRLTKQLLGLEAGK